MINDPVVSISEEDAFVDHVVSHLGDAPAIYGDIRKVNLGLVDADADRVEELEIGRNECALKS